MNKHIVLLVSGIVAVGTSHLSAASASSGSSSEVASAVERGKSWLASRQTENGAWEPVKYPAITAMALMACNEGAGKNRAQPDFVKKGYAYLLNCARPDGGFYTGTNYQNYNTSWTLNALAVSGRKEDAALIQKARPLISSWQIDLDEEGKRDNPLDGGIGYGDGTPRANLANTLAPLQALYETRAFAGANESKINREALLDFLHRTQNSSAVNREAYVCEDTANGGGFMYHPGKSFAGEVKMPNGQAGYRSYGSMTYAGLLCYFYAGVDQKAPEVQGALEWARRHFTVEENPGMDDQGLYYYYHLMARALAAYNVDKIKTADGKTVDWREALSRKLLALQKPDGSWVNAEGRWMEDNPVLCTAYALMALNVISQGAR